MPSGRGRASSAGAGPGPAAAKSSPSPGGARISASGTVSLLANDLVLHASSCPPNRSGLFFFGPAQAQVPFGNGWRCVAHPIRRFPVIFADGAGTASFAIDYATAPADRFEAGARWYLQFWYRDPAAGGATFNLSDGLAIRFCL